MKKNKSKSKTSKSSYDCIGWTLFAARIFLVAIFVMSLSGKLMDPSGTISAISSTGVPLAELFYAGAIALLAFGSISLILGWRVCLGSMALVVFTVFATVMFHIGEGQMIAFMKNLALVARQ